MKCCYSSLIAKGVALAAFVGAFSAVTAMASDDDVRLRAELKATDEGDDAEGDAEWRKQEDGKYDRIRFRVDVQDVERDGTGTVAVRRDGDVVFQGEIKIDDGQGRLELDTDDGDKVPNLQEGDVVEVADRKDVVVLTGTLKKD